MEMKKKFIKIKHKPSSDLANKKNVFYDQTRNYSYIYTENYRLNSVNYQFSGPSV